MEDTKTPLNKQPPIIARIDLELGIIRIEDMKLPVQSETIIAIKDHITEDKTVSETIEIILRRLKSENPDQDIFHTDY